MSLKTFKLGTKDKMGNKTSVVAAKPQDEEKAKKKEAKKRLKVFKRAARMARRKQRMKKRKVRPDEIMPWCMAIFICVLVTIIIIFLGKGEREGEPEGITFKEAYTIISLKDGHFTRLD